MSEQIPKKTRQRVRLKQNQGTIVRSKTTKVSGDVKSNTETVDRFVGVETNDPAYVTIGGKLTKNLGNYESVQITVSVTLPCEPSEGAVRDIRAKASSLVEEFMELELKSVEDAV